MLTKTFRMAVVLSVLSLSVLAAVPPSQHVVLLVEENHSYSSVINNPAMPYFNSLAKNYALLTNYYANVHGSLPNYLEMTTGQIETMNDAYTGTISADNVVRELLLMGKTWKSYAES